MQIKELISNATQTLNRHYIEDSNIKARVLLQHILKKDKNYLITNSNKEVSKQAISQYEKNIQELIEGRPLQYITKSQEFMGLDFYVDENVLIPQPDTEILVEETIKEIENTVKYEKENNIGKLKIVRILDMCTGSGAIAISIAKYFEENSSLNTLKDSNIKIKIYGVDISKSALEVAKKNARLNQVDVTWIKSNMFREILKYETEPFDIIVSNPPYIETDTIKTLSKEVRQEPNLALDGGKDGLDFYKVIKKEESKYLKRRGCILLEIGYNQKESVKKIFQEKNTQITCIKDLAENDRVIKIEYKL